MYKRQLDDLASYQRAAELERAAKNVVVDEAAVWNGPQTPEKAEEAKPEEKKDKPEEKKVTAEDDERARLFSPQGATLRGIVNEDAWITSGIDAVLPVLVSGSDVFLAKPPVTTAVRLDLAPTLRLAGLLWPEARARVADSAWLTVERKGSGQIILFSNQPAYRGYHLATARLFANAVVLGPGLGASQPVGW